MGYCERRASGPIEVSTECSRRLQSTLGGSWHPGGRRAGDRNRADSRSLVAKHLPKSRAHPMRVTRCPAGPAPHLQNRPVGGVIRVGTELVSGVKSHDPRVGTELVSLASLRRDEGGRVGVPSRNRHVTPGQVCPWGCRRGVSLAETLCLWVRHCAGVQPTCVRAGAHNARARACARGRAPAVCRGEYAMHFICPIYPRRGLYMGQAKCLATGCAIAGAETPPETKTMPTNKRGVQSAR